MVILGRGTVRPRPTVGRIEWGALVVTGLAAVVLWLLLGTAWPWALAVGVLLVSALIGVRRPGSLAAGLAAADLWWLLSVPPWVWSVAVGVAVLALGLWWLWTWRKTRPVLAPVAGNLPAVRATQVTVPPEGPNEVTTPIPRFGSRGFRGWIRPATAGRPVPLWQAVTALAVGAALLAAGVIGWRLDVADQTARQQAELDGAHQETISRILPHSSASAVQMFIRALADRDPDLVCWAMAPQAGRDFGRAFGVDSCARAIELLSRQVPHGIKYQNAAILALPGSATQYGKNRLIVDACHLIIDPPEAGPSAFGELTMDTAAGGGGGYQITAYKRCLT